MAKIINLFCVNNFEILAQVRGIDSSLMSKSLSIVWVAPLTSFLLSDRPHLIELVAILWPYTDPYAYKDYKLFSIPVSFLKLVICNFSYLVSSLSGNFIEKLTNFEIEDLIIRTGLKLAYCFTEYRIHRVE